MKVCVVRIYILFLWLAWAGAALAETGDSYLKKGNAYYRAGLLDQAIEQYRLALQINEAHIGAMHNLGISYQSKRDFTNAIATFQGIKKIDRLFVPAYISLGLVYAQKGCYKESEEEYVQAIALEPDNLVAHLNYAAILAKEEQYSKAVRAARRGLKIEPSNPHLHLLIAHACFKKQKYSLAKLEYLKALKAQPDAIVARLMLALSLAHLGQFDNALAHIQVARDLDPKLPELPRYAGKVYAMRFRAEQKGWKEAVDQLRQAANLSSDDTEVFKELGDILAAKSQFTEARRWYNRLLENPKASVEERQAVEALLQSWKNMEGDRANVSSKL